MKRLSLPCSCGAIVYQQTPITCTNCGKRWENENKFYADGYNAKLSAIDSVRHSDHIADVTTAVEAAVTASQYLQNIKPPQATIKIDAIIDGEPFTFQDDGALADHILSIMRKK